MSSVRRQTHERIMSSMRLALNQIVNELVEQLWLAPWLLL